MARLAQQAQLEIGYAYYKDKDPVSALAAADRFIKLHPNHPNVDYAYYLKGLVNFNEDMGLLGGISGQDMSERDPKAARESFEAFKELVTRFPDSKYSADAIRAHALSDQRHGAPTKCAPRNTTCGAKPMWLPSTARNSCWPTTSQSPMVEGALIVQVKAYDAMGLTELRDDTERLLRLNYPNTKFSLAGLRKKPWWQLF